MKTPLVALLISLTTPAFAGDWYAGVGASLATDSFEALGKDVFENLPDSVDGRTHGVDFLAGYRLNPHLALEAQTQFLQSFDLDDPADGSVQDNSYTLSAKVFPYPGHRVSPFLSAGFGILNQVSRGTVMVDGCALSLRDASSDWTGVFGAGVDVPFWDRFTAELAVRYLLPQDDLNEFDFWTVGANLQYAF